LEQNVEMIASFPFNVFSAVLPQPKNMLFGYRSGERFGRRGWHCAGERDVRLHAAYAAAQSLN